MAVVFAELGWRKVVGWSVGDRLNAGLSGEALRRALARRRPGPRLPFHRLALAGAGGITSVSTESGQPHVVMRVL
jgi:hypothetical protein